jgi:hypothetical protein
MGNDAPKSSIGMMILTDGQVFGEVEEVTEPKFSKEAKEYKQQYSPSKTVGRVPGWGSWDGLKFKITYTGNSAQRALLTDAKAGTKRLWQVIMPPEFVAADGTYDGFQFTGFISDVEPMADGDGIVYRSITVSVDGDVTVLTTRAAGLTSTFLAVADDEGHALTLSPTAAADTYYYTCLAYHSATEGVNSDTALVTPTAAGAGSVIRVNGVVVASGAASTGIPLGQNPGDKTMISVVVSEAGKIPVPYFIEVTMSDSPAPA